VLLFSLIKNISDFVALELPTENKLTLFWKKDEKEYFIAASPLKKGCKRV